GVVEVEAAVNGYPIGNTMITPEGFNDDKVIFVRIWDMNRCRPVRIVKAHDEKIVCLTKSFDTKYFTTSSTDGRARIFDMASGSLYKEFTFAGFAVRVTLSPDSRFLAAWNFDGAITVYYAGSGEVVKTIESQVSPYCASISRDNRLIIFARENTAYIYDMLSGKLVKTFDLVKDHAAEGERSYPQIVMAGAKHCYISIEGNEALIRSIFDDSCVAVCAHRSKISSYGVNNKNSMLMLTSADNRTSVWELENYTRVNEISHVKNDNLMLTSSSGRHLLVHDKPGTSSVRLDLHNIKGNRLDASLYYFYKYGLDFCITTPPDAVSKTGWIQTNRPDLVQVERVDEKGRLVEILKNDDPRRLEYIKSIERPDIVHARINDFEKYLQMLDEIKHGANIRHITNRRNTALKMLE
ncbi:MAG: protein kinase, partial [uncultured bacterium]